VAATPIRISFTLGQPADVTVEIGAHLAVAERSSKYLPDPPVVRTLKAGWLEAGCHEMIWDGLEGSGKPVVERLLRAKRDLRRLAQGGTVPQAADLVGEQVVNLFNIRVRSGGDILATNFSRLDGVVPADHAAIAGFDSTVSDGEGGYFAVSG